MRRRQGLRCRVGGSLGPPRVLCFPLSDSGSWCNAKTQGFLLITLIPDAVFFSVWRKRHCWLSAKSTAERGWLIVMLAGCLATRALLGLGTSWTAWQHWYETCKPCRANQCPREPRVLRSFVDCSHAPSHSPTFLSRWRASSDSTDRLLPLSVSLDIRTRRTICAPAFHAPDGRMRKKAFQPSSPFAFQACCLRRLQMDSP